MTLWRSVTVAAVLFALANALYSAWDQGWTYDEPYHLEWSERLLTSRIAEREIPHYNAKTPAILPNVATRMALRHAPADDPVLRFASRLPSILWLAALLATTFALGRRFFGSEAAHIATAAAALDPNLVAHGSVATVDVAYALATLLTLATAARFTEGPSPWRSAKLGLALGFAFAVKFSAVLLVPALLLLPALKRPPRREWLRWTLGALVVGAVAAATVCVAYLFVDVATPLGARQWHSAPMARLASALPGLRLPLPAAFLTGFDASLAAERGEWNVVILGRLYPYGIWFYFGVLWLLKTPLLVLLAEVYGLWRAARGERLGGASLGAQLLVVTLILHLSYFSFLYRTQLGYRFVLMCVPLAYILAAAGLASLTGHRRAPAAAAVIILAAVLENGMYFGNPLAFTNAGVWPKRQAFRLIADSNLDWGQHDETIEQWLANSGVHTHLNPPHFLPGHNTFSVNEVAGVSDFERHRFLRENADPMGHFAHTHVWFDVDDGVFNRFLDAKRRLSPEPEAEAACPADLPYETFPPGSQVNLSRSRPPAINDTWIVCVSTRQGTDFGLRALRGPLELGRYREGTACEGEIVGAGQEIWHRLDAGTHAFCAAERSHRVRWIPHPVGAWLVRNGEASLHVREAVTPVDPFR